MAKATGIIFSVLGPGVYPKAPYGSFSGKLEIAKATGIIFSVLGPGAYPKAPYGSFSGKVEVEGVATQKRLFIANVGRLMNQ